MKRFNDLPATISRIVWRMLRPVTAVIACFRLGWFPRALFQRKWVVPLAPHPLPTAVIDMSVLQRIAELSWFSRQQAWAELHSRFDVVIPAVLVDEVLVNLGDPGKKSPRVVRIMFEDLLKRRGWWIADEIEWAFDEIVRGNRAPGFKPMNPEYLNRVATFRPKSQEFQNFLHFRRTQGAVGLQQNIALQHEAATWRRGLNLEGESSFVDEHGRIFFLVANEKEFFQRFVSPGFHQRDQIEGRWFEMFENLFGQPMRIRYPEHAAEIEAAFRKIGMRQLFECHGTFYCLLARLFYLWAPVVRIGKSRTNSRKIIGRTDEDQASNINDMRYVGTAILCTALLTRDAEMARMGDCFKRCGLWNGTAYFLVHPDMDILDEIVALPKRVNSNKPECG